MTFGYSTKQFYEMYKGNIFNENKDKKSILKGNNDEEENN